jgi:hypothetical protein
MSRTCDMECRSCCEQRTAKGLQRIGQDIVTVTVKVSLYVWGVQEMSTESHRIKMGDLWVLNGARGSRGKPCSLISKPISQFLQQISWRFSNTRVWARRWSKPQSYDSMWDAFGGIVHDRSSPTVVAGRNSLVARTGTAQKAAVIYGLWNLLFMFWSAKLMVSFRNRSV